MSWSEKIYGGFGWVIGGAFNLGCKSAGLIAQAVSSDKGDGEKGTMRGLMLAVTAIMELHKVEN